MRRRKIRYFPPQQLIPIFATLIALFAVITMRDSCARGVENMFRAFEAPDAGPGIAPAVPRPGGSGGPTDPAAPPPPVTPPIVPAGATPDAGSP